MGETCVEASTMIKWLILALVLNACTHAYDQFDQESSDAMDSDAMDDAMPMAMPSAAQKPVKSLMEAVQRLHKHVPVALKEHTRTMKHHASLIEDRKASWRHHCFQCHQPWQDQGEAFQVQELPTEAQGRASRGGKEEGSAGRAAPRELKDLPSSYHHG